MKTTFCTIALLLATFSLQAQTTTITTTVTPTKTTTAHLTKDAQPRSVATSVTTTSSVTTVSLLYLADGLGNSATALFVPAGTIGNNSKLHYGVIGAVSLSSNTQVYAGAGVSYLVYQRAGWSLTGYAGFKGLDLSSGFSVPKGMSNLVVGFGVSSRLRGCNTKQNPHAALSHGWRHAVVNTVTAG